MVPELDLGVDAPGVDGTVLPSGELAEVFRGIGSLAVVCLTAQLMGFSGKGRTEGVL